MLTSGTIIQLSRRFLVVHIAATALVVASVQARASEPWSPKRPIEWVVPAGAGGGFDRSVRVLQSIISEKNLLPVPLIVMNKPGAGGAIAWTHMIQRQQVVEIISVSAPNLLTNEISGTSTIGAQDLTPIVNLYEEFSVVTVRAGSSISSGRNLIERLRADPGSVSIAIAPGLGSGNHLAVVAALRAAAVDIRQLRVVPYPSSGASARALLGGEVDAMSSSTAVAAPFVDAGKVRVIAASAFNRLDGVFAASPTWREQGINSQLPSWLNVLGPREMPTNRLAYYEEVLAKSTQTPEWKEYLRKTYHPEKFMRSAETRQYLMEKRKIILELMTELGLAKR